MKVIKLDLDEVKKVFRLVDGKLERLKYGRWKDISNNKPDGSGYILVKFKDRTIRAHRIIWMLHNDQEITEGYQIDHISGVRNDNNPSNLRLATSQENTLNRKCHRKGQLPYCTFDKQREKWKSQFKLNGKMKHNGRYNTMEEAHIASMAAMESNLDYKLQPLT